VLHIVDKPERRVEENLFCLQLADFVLAFALAPVSIVPFKTYDAVAVQHFVYCHHIHTAVEDEP